jgi:hypothetical protein
VVGEFKTQEAFDRDLPSEGEEEEQGSRSLTYKQFLWERKTVSTMFGRYYEGTRSPSAGIVPAQGGSGRGSAFTYQFNAEKGGWNYGWASNKHKTKDWHVFQVSVYVLTTSGSPDSEADGDSEDGGRMEEEEEEKGEGEGVSPHASFSLVLRTASPPFRILSARRYEPYLFTHFFLLCTFVASTFYLPISSSRLFYCSCDVMSF